MTPVFWIVGAVALYLFLAYGLVGRMEGPEGAGNPGNVHGVWLRLFLLPGALLIVLVRTLAQKRSS
jgi:hypothetical protein